jgi:hypothetical protein
MYFEYVGSGWQHHVSQDWGSCRRFVEVLHDQLAARQIDLYENGFVLKYDRLNNRDEFGILIGLKFSRKDKWRKSFKGIEVVSQSEFDALWRTTVRTIPAGCAPPKGAVTPESRH